MRLIFTLLFFATTGICLTKDSGIVILPTAYRVDDKSGFNVDWVALFYIGHLYQKIKGSVDELVPTRVLLMGPDLKFSLKEGKFMPATGVGVCGLLRLPFGQTQKTQYITQISSKTEFTYYLYFTLTKVFLERISLNFGIFRGDINFLFEPLYTSVQKFSNLAYISAATLYLGKNKFSLELIRPKYPKSHILLHSIMLKFLGFDLGYIKVEDGYSILGYFNFRFTMYPR